MAKPKFDPIYSIFRLLNNTVFLFFKWLVACIIFSFCWLIAISGDGKIKGQLPPKELRSLTPQGFIFGKKAGWWVVKKEGKQGHILIIAGTGKGKTESHFKPTEISLKGLQITTDITEDGELIDLAKERGIKCQVISFNDPNSLGYDPYYLLKRAVDKDEEADILARAIVPDPKPNEGNPMWQSNAQLIVKNSILHFSDLGYSFLETMNEILESGDLIKLLETLGNSQIDAARKGMIALSKSSEKTVGGIYSQLLARISVLTTNQRLIHLLSTNKTVKFSCLKNGYSIFVHLPEHVLDTCRPFSAMFFNQLFNYLERRSLGQPPLTIHIDEVTRWGEISALVKGSTTLRKRNITLVAAAQSFGQIKKAYGQEDLETVIDNFDYMAIQGIKYPQYQKMVSEMIGLYEKKQKSESESYHDREKYELASTSSSESSHKDWILPSADLGKLKDIVVLHPDGHSRVNKMMYYKYKHSHYRYL